jgi:hypothetical protein
MTQNSYTEVRTQSWFSRIRDSFIGVLLGLLLFAVSFFVLWYNEGRSVKTAEALREVQQTVIPLTGTEVASQNEGKLLYVTGTAKTSETLTDESLGITANAVKLLREVEMYQWVESSKSESKEKLGGGKETVTTYTYETKWSGSPQDSSQFKKPEGHINPATAYTNTTITAKHVSLGSFLLSPGLVDKINPTESLVLQNGDLDQIAASIRSQAKLADGYLYLGYQGAPEPMAPRVGDYRIRYRIVPAEITLSIISKQIANTFEPYRAKSGRLIELVETGTVSANAMVENAQKSNQLITWLLRLLGFVLMFAGLMLCFKPLSIFAAVIPVLGRIIGAGTGLVAFLLALALSLITIAIAWIVYRPVMAIILILVAVFAVYLAIRSRKKPGVTKSLQSEG